MMIIMEAALAVARKTSVNAVIEKRALEAEANTPNAGGTNGPNVGGTNGPNVGERTQDTILRLSNEAPETLQVALSLYIKDRKILSTPQERAEDFTDMVVGFREIREQLEEAEKMAGRAARLEGVSVRQIANAAGISERNAQKRYRIAPGEGLSSKT